MPHFTRTDEDGILTITFIRDGKLNAISEDMLDGLRQAVSDLGERPDLRVLLITAQGRYFTAGIDLTRFEGDQAASGVALRHGYRRLHTLFDEFQEVEKPVVLAAQGPCLGVGVEMAATCDFRLGSQSSHFALPEISTLAVLPGSGGMSRLTRLVGPHWARWMAMAAQPVPAQQAREIGFLHQVFPDDEFVAGARAFAEHLAGLSVEALGLAKVAIDGATTADRATARGIDRMANTLLLQSEEHRAAVDRWANRPRG